MSAVPKLPLIHHQQQQLTNTAPSSGRTISASRTKYTLTPRAHQTLEDALAPNANRLTPRSQQPLPSSGYQPSLPANDPPRILTGRDLRSINKFIDSNRSLQHQHRAGRVDDLIPPSAFQKVEDSHDTHLGLSLAPVGQKESALDVPLRFATPRSFHAPELKDLHIGTSLSTRLVAMLKGTSGVPIHWEGEREGEERNFTHTNLIKDLEMKAMMAKRANDVHSQALAVFSIASLRYNAGHKAKARQLFLEASTLFESIQDAQGAALCQNIVGVCFMHRGEHKTALAHHRKQEALSGPYARCVAQINMGVCYGALGEHEFAEQAFVDALRSATEANDSILEAVSRGNLGIAYMRQGNMKSAQAQFEACLEQCSVAGDKVGAAVCLLLLGQVHAECGDAQHAQFYQEHTLRVANEARCSDIADVAKVSIGIARANQTARDTMFSQANKMGGEVSVAQLMLALPKY